jgi:hypothetical protein
LARIVLDTDATSLCRKGRLPRPVADLVRSNVDRGLLHREQAPPGNPQPAGLR